MALNGTTEAFVFARGSQETLAKVHMVMTANSVMYLCGGFGLTYFLTDIRGIIYANCTNMALRAGSSLYLAAV